MDSTRSYEIKGYKALNQERHVLEVVSHRLCAEIVSLAKGCAAVLVFVSDDHLENCERNGVPTYVI